MKTLRIASCFKRFALHGAMAWVFFARGIAMVQSEEPTNWKTGVALTKALQSETSFTWSERPLGDGFASLRQSTSIAVLLDRRVDPSQRITASHRSGSLSDALKELAQSHDLSIGMVGAVVYVGPANNAGRLQALAALKRRELAKAAGRQRWLEPQPMGWEELSEPRQLVQHAAQVATIELTNLAAIPHDVWPAWRGPATATVDQLTLLLAQFDLRLEFNNDASQAAIVPLEKELAYSQSYTVTGEADKVLAELRLLAANMKLTRESATKFVAEGTAEQHRQVANVVAGNRENSATKTIKKPGEKVFTLKVENQIVGRVIQTIANELSVEVAAEEALVEKLKQRTSVQVEKVSAERLLREVLDPLEIEFTLNEKTLQLRAK